MPLQKLLEELKAQLAHLDGAGTAKGEEQVVVGVNRFTSSDGDAVEIMKVGPRHQVAQARALKRLRAKRPKGVLERHSAAIEKAARGTDNLMPPLKAALADYVTIGECCTVLRRVFGEYRPTEAA